MTKRTRKRLSPANLEIMKVIWEKGEVTVNDVFDEAKEKKKGDLRRTTIQVQMNRLEEYGWLKHRLEGRTFFYSAVEEKQKTRQEILNDIKNRVFGGSQAELVRCLLEDADIHPDEIKELRQLIVKYEGGKK